MRCIAGDGSVGAGPCGGFNDVRKRELTPGPMLNPDESMMAWKVKSGVGGAPSFVIYKTQT